MTQISDCRLSPLMVPTWIGKSLAINYWSVTFLNSLSR